MSGLAPKQVVQQSLGRQPGPYPVEQFGYIGPPAQLGAEVAGKSRRGGVSGARRAGSGPSASPAGSPDTRRPRCGPPFPPAGGEPWRRRAAERSLVPPSSVRRSSCRQGVPIKSVSTSRRRALCVPERRLAAFTISAEASRSQPSDGPAVRDLGRLAQRSFPLVDGPPDELGHARVALQASHVGGFGGDGPGSLVQPAGGRQLDARFAERRQDLVDVAQERRVGARPRAPPAPRAGNGRCTGGRRPGAELLPSCRCRARLGRRGPRAAERG